MQIDTLHEMLNLFSGKHKKKNIDLLSAELAHRVVKVKHKMHYRMLC